MKESKEYLENRKIEQICIGFIDDTTCSAEKTKEQIDFVISHKIKIHENGQDVCWSDLYDKENKENRSIFNSIIFDRSKRVNKKIPMADRPRFAVCTFIDNICERIEYYEGHDRLEKVYDFRSIELKKIEMKDFLVEDEYSYDPIEFLKSINVIDANNEKTVKDMLEILHSSNEEELKNKVEKYLNDKK